MQEYLARYFFYFFESLFEFFWCAFSHTIKIDIALELDTTPSENPNCSIMRRGLPIHQ